MKPGACTGWRTRDDWGTGEGEWVGFSEGELTATSVLASACGYREPTKVFSPAREGAVPYTDTAWCLGHRAVSRRLPEQQLLSLQPQVLVAALGAQ